MSGGLRFSRLGGIVDAEVSGTFEHGGRATELRPAARTSSPRDARDEIGARPRDHADAPVRPGPACDSPTTRVHDPRVDRPEIRRGQRQRLPAERDPAARGGEAQHAQDDELGATMRLRRFIHDVRATLVDRGIPARQANNLPRGSALKAPT